VGERLYKDDPWGVTKVEMMLFGLATTDVARQTLEAYVNLGNRKRKLEEVH
jgi:hypothetical protein